ncbi:hypothetical protein [Burkholderia multivorans]|uniref:hypothetical protein n=2 Tax=Burkholderia multivorans TaxID=87883 RepID=UPI0011B22F00|nr:hypothetical protein [Burkholderia multivorans]
MSGSLAPDTFAQYGSRCAFLFRMQSRMADVIEEWTVSTFREIRVQALQQALIDEARGFRIDNEVAESVIARLDAATLAARISIVNRSESSAERSGSLNRPGRKGDSSNS